MTATLSPTLASLHRAILEDPADDDRRLIYAERLEDEGQLERADFIRVQCRLPHAPQNGGCYDDWPKMEQPGGHGEDGWCEFCRLVHREQDLWYSPARGFDSTTMPPDATLTIGQFMPDCVKLQGIVRRGFVAEVSCTAAEFVTHARALFSAHPVERVKISNGLLFRIDRTRQYQLVYRVKHWHFYFNEKGIWADDATTYDINSGDSILQALLASAVSEACVAYGNWLRDQPEEYTGPYGPPTIEQFTPAPAEVKISVTGLT